MKISSILREFLSLPAINPGDGPWTDDPYAHPDIRAMSERERADLPPVHMPEPGPAPIRGGTPAGVRSVGLVACV
jgi:hypothetical protein